jgi:hypothetical protein
MRWNKLSPDIELTPGHRLLLVDPNSYLLWQKKLRNKAMSQVLGNY